MNKFFLRILLVGLVVFNFVRPMQETTVDESKKELSVAEIKAATKILKWYKKKHQENIAISDQKYLMGL